MPRPIPPSIPAKKLSNQCYSAVGTDTVGPALYEPKLNIAKHKAPEPNFHKSKAARKVFEPSIEITNILPSKENPGPAHYEKAEKALSKQFNAQGNTTSFLSKVPNCKDTKISN